MSNTNETDWAQIINWVLTIVLIIAILYAGHQRYFEDMKCEKWCTQNIVKAQLEKGEQIFNCEVDWNSVFAEEQDYPQKINLAPEGAK